MASNEIFEIRKIYEVQKDNGFPTIQLAEGLFKKLLIEAEKAEHVRDIMMRRKSILIDEKNEAIEDANYALAHEKDVAIDTIISLFHEFDNQEEDRI